jgi:chitosanase
MIESDIDFIRRVLSVAECGTEEFKYSDVYIYADDSRFSPARRQITYSIGFTEGGGNLKKVLEAYIAAGGAFARDLQTFIPGLGDKSRRSLAGNQAFIALLKVAGKEPTMREVQHQQFDRMYLRPAITWGESYKFTLNLSFLVIADSYLHSGSMLGFLMARFPEKKPVDGGDEKEWINAYLQIRHDWLRTHSNKILNKTTYRADCYLREAAKGNWDLIGSFMMNGIPVARIV